MTPVRSLRDISLGKQFALACVLLSFLSVSCVSLVDAVFRSRELQTRLQNQAVLYATQLRRQLAPVIAFNDTATAREIFESLQLDSDVAGLAVYAANGELLEGVGAYPDHADGAPTPARSGAALIVVRGDISSRQGITGELYVSLSKARIRSSQLQAAWIAASTAAVTLLIAVLLTGPISRRLTGRLSRIVDMAASLAHGDFARPPIEDAARDEVGVLSRAVNKMRAELSRLFGELAAAAEARRLADAADNAKLEALVAERTANLQASQEQAKGLAERFGLAADAAGIGVWDWDLNSNRLLWDEQTYELYGRPRPDGELSFSDWMSYLHGYDRERVFAELIGAMDSGSKFDAEFRIVTPAQQTRHLKATAEVQPDSSGSPGHMIGVSFDITERKLAEFAVRESERNFRSLFDLSPAGMILVDRKTQRFLQVNDAFVASSGYTREELMQMSVWDTAPASRAFREATESDQLQFGPLENEHQRKDGSTFPAMVSGQCMQDASGRDIIWAIVQDISLQKSMELKLVEAARRDKLTGLANRELFMSRLEKAVARVREGTQALYAVLFLDFDRFKLVNDTLGHEGGDELLRQIARRLQGELRASDTLTDDDAGTVVSRFGGDEFLLLLNDLKSPADARRIGERLLKTLNIPYDILGSEINTSASVGIVTSLQCHANAEEIVRDADVAMYEAKRAGRACCVEFDGAMQTRLLRHVTIETSLRRAIGTDELYLLYQPIVDINTGRMVSAEALIRWNHPTLGAIAPSEFIPIAEESGLIVAVGEWVQAQACRALALWRAQDPGRAPETVSVNVSRAELALGGALLAQVRNVLEASGLPARCLQLEITEREVMRQPEAAHALLTELQGLGVRIAMDDFGTGTSSLGVLRNYPFNTIKIDRAFVQDLTPSHDVLAIIHATINLVENLGMSSLAEGVENEVQLAILQSLGCRYAQGYLFSRPVPPERLLEAGNARQAPAIELAAATADLLG
jgi:diguanylate cyclase (GGDEF)-like protein/PAS domain S-box-containing protein